MLLNRASPTSGGSTRNDSLTAAASLKASSLSILPALLSSTLKSLFAIAENYPVLKASDNFKLLQEQLEGIENKIAYARQYYNSSVLNYNNVITTIPGTWFAGNRTKHGFLEIPQEERGPVKVKF